MYEYEFWSHEAKDYMIFFGYSLSDVKRRNPDVDFSELVMTGKWVVE